MLVLFGYMIGIEQKFRFEYNAFSNYIEYIS